MINIIEIGSPAFNEMMQQVVQAAVKTCRDEMKQDDDLLTQEQAMVLLKVKSKQKMQQIRENGIVKSKKLGKVILYSKKSILEWINK